MNPYRPRPSRSRGLAEQMERRPLASRLLLMVGAFLLLIPVAGIMRGTGTNVVKTGGLPGAAVGADPLLTATTPAPTASASTAAASGAAALAPALSPAPTAAATSAASTGPSADASARATSSSAGTVTSPPTTASKTTTTPVTSAAKKSTTTTTATTAKKAPATTAAPKVTSPPTTKAPATTAPPPTTAPTTRAAPAAPPANRYSKADVEAIIREIWPADLADEAVRIAKRESNLVPTVRNWCCFGLFQIYYEMNQKTLSGLGISSAEQLYDPRVNATAAYAMYQRVGWAPWS
jgi:hypothetical protein